MTPPLKKKAPRGRDKTKRNRRKTSTDDIAAKLAGTIDWAWYDRVVGAATIESTEGTELLAEAAVTIKAAVAEIRGRLERREPVSSDELKALPSLASRAMQLATKLGIDVPKKREKKTFT